MITIKVGDVHSWISKADVIRPLLTYSVEWWVQGPFRKMKQTGQKALVSKKGFFLSGFIPRVSKYLNKKKIKFQIKDERGAFMEIKDPFLPGIRFRKDQRQALEDILIARRGVWQAPTGSGKTLLIAGILSAFPDYSSIVVVHTKALFKQTIAEMERFFDDVGWFGAGEKKEGKIIVAMRQTLAKHIQQDTAILDAAIIIIDEAHHVSTFKGEYAKILERITAPVRIGFTATVPKTEEAKMAIEGLIGPKIGETKYGELEKAAVLAKPKIKMFKVPVLDKYKRLRGTYGEVYDQGIVRNRKRNVMIVNVAKEQIEKGKTVLIMVERIPHGEELLSLFEIKCPGVFTFVQGQTKDEVREEYKRVFELKEQKGVIATRVWSEGVNIKSVDVVINAVGGESEIAAIQRFGRGMRRTDGKRRVLLIDFIDINHEWFQRHSLSRVCYYSEWGWL